MNTEIMKPTKLSQPMGSQRLLRSQPVRSQKLSHSRRSDSGADNSQLAMDQTLFRRPESVGDITMMSTEFDSETSDATLFNTTASEYAELQQESLNNQ